MNFFDGNECHQHIDDNLREISFATQKNIYITFHSLYSTLFHFNLLRLEPN